jgi:hypothetical protein
MKFLLEGTLLDTEKILSITELEGNEIWSKFECIKRDESLDLIDFRKDIPLEKDKTIKGMRKCIITHSGFYFTIKMINGNEHKVYKTGDEENPEDTFWYYDKYPETIWTVACKVDAMRKKVIALWEQDQNKFPQINY